MKKKLLSLTIIIVLLFACSKDININNVHKQPNFKGVVKEVSKQSILVFVDENEEEIKSSDLISVSLDTVLKEEVLSFNPGDKVLIYYDGTISQSYPAQITKVYLITILD